jgi:hypothetical protein
LKVDIQEMNMAGFIHTEPPNVGHEIDVKGAISSEDAGFYIVVISAIIFVIAALTGNLV